MPKEPGEKSQEEMEKELLAGQTLVNFFHILHDAENNPGSKIVDLNKPSMYFPAASKKDALIAISEQMKNLLDYLGPKERKAAEGFLLRTDIYLTAHKPEE